jgi:REP element-mobilizing transposase RayT
MKRILLVEPEEQLAAHLFQLLVRSGDFVVSAAPSQREAALIVAEQPQDLAVVPVEVLSGALAVLRSLQPDLRMVALLPPGVDAPPETVAGQLQGVLYRRGLETSLPEVLAAALASEVSVPAAPPVVDGTRPETMAALLQGAALHEKVLSALVGRGGELLAHAGTLEEQQAAEVAAHVAETWTRGHAAQVQFLRLQSRSNDLLLYTRPAGREHLLTLAARPEAAVGEMREQAEALATSLLPVLDRDSSVATEPESAAAGSAAPAADAVSSASYALVWRAQRPLARPMEITVRKVLEQLAADNACSLVHLEVDGQLVHVVVECPPESSSTWVVRLLKDGSEAEIQAQSGVASRLWEKGYYAVPSVAPLGDVELSLFAQQSP